MRSIIAALFALFLAVPAFGQVSASGPISPGVGGGGGAATTDASELTSGQLPVGRLTDFLATANTWGAKQTFFAGDGSTECNGPFIEAASGGATLTIATNGTLLNVCRNGSVIAQFGPLFYASNGMEIRGTSGLIMSNGTGGITMAEQADPAAPGADNGTLFMDDVGGKTALCARFNTGSPVCSTELVQP